MLRIGSLFAGVGGLDLGIQRAFDAETAWVSDNMPAAARVLAARFPHAPNLGDVTAIDWKEVQKEAPVDVVAAGFP